METRSCRIVLRILNHARRHSGKQCCWLEIDLEICGGVRFYYNRRYLLNTTFDHSSSRVDALETYENYNATLFLTDDICMAGE